jgi:hypothetical protein
VEVVVFLMINGLLDSRKQVQESNAAVLCIARLFFQLRAGAPRPHVTVPKQLNEHWDVLSDERLNASGVHGLFVRAAARWLVFC